MDENGVSTRAVSLSLARARVALIVEDDSTIRDALRVLLEDEGFEIMLASTLARARQVLFASSSNVGVVVLDLALADGDAEPLVEELHQAGRRAPALVLVSAHAQRLISVAMAYAVPYVTKPFDMNVLATTVTVAFDQTLRPHRLPSSAESGRRRRIVI